MYVRRFALCLERLVMVLPLHGVFTLHFQKLASGLSVENPLLPTILSSLKEVAKINAEVFEGDVDSVIKEFAVKKVLRRDETVSDAMNDTLILRKHLCVYRHTVHMLIQ